MHQPYVPPPLPNRRRGGIGLAIVAGFVGLAAGCAGGVAIGAAGTATPEPMPATTTAEVPVIAGGSGSPSAKPSKTVQIINPGTHRVPEDVKPGTYRTQEEGCYWARRRSLDGGSVESIIENGNTVGSTIVKIAKTDKAFESTCTWSQLT